MLRSMSLATRCMRKHQHWSLAGRMSPRFASSRAALSYLAGDLEAPWVSHQIKPPPSHANHRDLSKQDRINKRTLLTSERTREVAFKTDPAAGAWNNKGFYGFWKRMVLFGFRNLSKIFCLPSLLKDSLLSGWNRNAGVYSQLLAIGLWGLVWS